MLSTQIASLEKLTAFQDKQIETLSKQLENAYGKVQDIAVKAVGSAQAANISPNRAQAGSPEPESI